MIRYKKNPEGSTEKVIETINQFKKWEVTKSVKKENNNLSSPLCTNSELEEGKYLRVNLIKGSKEFPE